jgi:hypothetical protein
MMHGREKSDSAILAVKPPNGAGVPAEEGVERRAEAEGNAGQDRTHRAQDRESVSQGLERVRHVARTRNGSPRSFTTSAPSCSGWHSSLSSDRPPPAWTG